MYSCLLSVTGKSPPFLVMDYMVSLDMGDSALDRKRNFKSTEHRY
jgi:hypothetical protein